jgi:hypothetical protein
MSRRKHVAFHQVKEEDVAFLRSTFEQLQVEFSISDTSPYQILVFNESWSKFFLAEYGHLYGAEGEVDVEDDVEADVADDAAAADDDDGDERMDDGDEPSQSSLAFVTKFVSSTIDTDVRKNSVLRTAAMYEQSLATAVPLVAPPSRELPTPGVGARRVRPLLELGRLVHGARRHPERQVVRVVGLVVAAQVDSRHRRGPASR